MRLTVIGCTGSFPGPVSPASCYMLTATDFAGRTWRIIMDMGNGSLGMLQRHIDLSDIDAILISHLHPDHCIDLSGLHVAVKWDRAAGLRAVFRCTVPPQLTSTFLRLTAWTRTRA